MTALAQDCTSKFWAGFLAISRAAEMLWNFLDTRQRREFNAR